MTKVLPALLAVLLVALTCGPAAARMYRCGNAFQDRPCDDVEQQQVVKPGRALPPALAASSPRGAASAASADAVKQPAASVTAPVPMAAPVVTRPGQSPICANLQEQRAAIDARVRGSRNPATVEMFKRQQRELERSLADAGCTV